MALADISSPARPGPVLPAGSRRRRRRPGAHGAAPVLVRASAGPGDRLRRRHSPRRPAPTMQRLARRPVLARARASTHSIGDGTAPAAQRTVWAPEPCLAPLLPSELPRAYREHDTDSRSLSTWAASPPVAAAVRSTDRDDDAELKVRGSFAVVARFPQRTHGGIRAGAGRGPRARSRAGSSSTRAASRCCIGGLRAVDVEATVVDRVPTLRQAKTCRARGPPPPARVDRTRADGGRPTHLRSVGASFTGLGPGTGRRAGADSCRCEQERPGPGVASAG